MDFSRRAHVSSVNQGRIIVWRLFTTFVYNQRTISVYGPVGGSIHVQVSCAGGNRTCVSRGPRGSASIRKIGSSGQLTKSDLGDVHVGGTWMVRTGWRTDVDPEPVSSFLMWILRRHGDSS